MSIYVAGSLAFDRIMSFNGAFADHILADKPVSYTHLTLPTIA